MNADKFIKWPNTSEQQEIARFFVRHRGIPNVSGIVDGTYVKIIGVTELGTEYYCRKKFPAINVQLICDHNLLITNAYIGWPGSTHDARVFRNSMIGANLETYIAPGQHLLGDSAYPLSQYLMKPYSNNGHLSHSQVNFNRHLSGSRSYIEITNAYLKGRNRRLKGIDCTDIQRICNLIMAACCVHNMCLLCDEVVEDFMDLDPEPKNNYPGIYRNSDIGKIKRDAIAAAF